MIAAFSALIAAVLAGTGSELLWLHQRVSQLILLFLLFGDYLLYRSARKRLQALHNAGAGANAGGNDGEIDSLHARARRMVLIIWGVDVPIMISFALINLYVDLHQHVETLSANTASNGHAEVAAEFFYYGATALQLFLANVAIITLSIVAEYETYKSKMSIGKFFMWQFVFGKPPS